MSEKLDTIVIGAGQAGLSAGYHLAKRGKPFVILDAADRVGGSWLNRWDSLKLFTPSIRDNLPGLPLGGELPLPDQGRDARLPRAVRRDVRAAGAARRQGRRALPRWFGLPGHRGRAGVRRGPRDPRDRRAPGAADARRSPTICPSDIVQLHSADYRNPGQLAPGPVLLVGAGNSGAEIAMDLAPTHQVLMAGRTVGEIPIDIRGWQGRLMFPVLWWVWEHILTERTRPGRKVQAEAVQGPGRPVDPAEGEGHPAGGRRAHLSDHGSRRRPARRTRTARCSTSPT